MNSTCHHARPSLGQVFAADAPRMQSDDDRQIEICICGKSIAYDEDEDRWVDVCERPVDAQKTPDGKWVCSDLCYSQAMYESADEATKISLDRIADALNVLSNHLDADTVSYLDKWLSGADKTRDYGRGMDALLRISDLRYAHISQGTEPEWLNRPTREEQLERELRSKGGAL